MMQMNNNPFYRTRWAVPESQSPPRYNYKTPSKVVTIPVHFVGSERSRNVSAIKIQKVLRGFLVRNIVRKISGIRVELEQIENKVSANETVELMRKEQRERVRVSETIMNLLLQLDSVRVLHYSGLRECRKTLIKKAITLQEMVDQMVLVGPSDQDQPQMAQAEGVKMEALENEEKKMTEEDKCVGASLDEENFLGVECGEKMEDLRSEEIMEVKEKEEEDGEGQCVGEESVGTCLVEEVGENYLVREEEGQAECECECEEHEEGEKMETLREEEVEVGKESVGTSLVDENCSVKEEEKDGKRELLEKMMEDNEKMMVMMQQLFKRNEMQTRLLSSLSHRVEQLERAFACEKLRRKKKNADPKLKENDPKNGSI
ncbi:neurofilament medium polypeptide-like [Abrus precatorius]|uniref:Neurofilament medium polypeptide-like n=1 Tax=Abrus precatorius TaxID=3816 RepID=A0A8B8L5J0_ABRPR|nr:neurofilament medium polypeptide-like [Abrus precatorius]